jgi:hypothetical protein
LLGTGGTCSVGKKAVGTEFIISTSTLTDRSDIIVWESGTTGGGTAWIVGVIADDNNNNVTLSVTTVCVNQ